MTPYNRWVTHKRDRWVAVRAWLHRLYCRRPFVRYRASHCRRWWMHL
jgi:hypothetical protein